MAKSNWIGAWAGGRVSQGADGKRLWWIEKMVEKERYSIRLVGVETEPQATKEYLIFRGNPATYEPPSIRSEQATLDEADRVRVEAAGKIVLNEDFIGRCVAAMKAGYGSKLPVSEHHAFVTHSFLTDWATSPALFGKDLRKVTLSELRGQLDEWKGSTKHRIVALRSFTAWCRWRGDLKRTEDPTLDLSVPQARKPTPEERSKKIYTVEQLEETYRHIPNQAVRDVFRVRVHTGLHETEIERIAAGKCVIKELKGKIAATVDYPHKDRTWKRASVDRPTLAAITRLRALKGEWPTEKTLARNREKAAELSGQPEVFIGWLRHTRITLASEIGTVVYPKRKAGVPLELIARSVGHHDTSTTIGHYLGQNVPPMIVIPVKLVHSKDPK